MKKTQKDQIKKGSETARACYQAFMAQPEWMTYVKKEDLVSFLKKAIESEEINYSLLLAAFKQRMALHDRTKKWDDLKASVDINNEATDRLEGLIAARTLLHLFEGTDPFYQAPSMVHHDFSMICRDN